MTEPLDLARFKTLAEAYGSVINRWPAEVQVAARAMALEAAAKAILAEAGQIDRMLDLWRPEEPSPTLAARLGNAAPTMRIIGGRRARLWWIGIGLAAALSGAAAGGVAAATLTPPDRNTDSSTLFGDIVDQDD